MAERARRRRNKPCCGHRVRKVPRKVLVRLLKEMKRGSLERTHFLPREAQKHERHKRITILHKYLYFLRFVHSCCRTLLCSTIWAFNNVQIRQSALQRLWMPVARNAEMRVHSRSRTQAQTDQHVYMRTCVSTRTKKMTVASVTTVSNWCLHLTAMVLFLKQINTRIRAQWTGSLSFKVGTC